MPQHQGHWHYEGAEDKSQGHHGEQKGGESFAFPSVISVISV